MFSIPFTVKKSISMDRPVEEVYKLVADFSTWPIWSPWLCQEPDCEVTIAGTPGAVGHKQEWNGAFIGAGNMTLSKASANESLDYDLFFLKPWKTRSKVLFQFAADGQGTLVTWWMHGSLPIFMFFMKKMMDAFVGGDYKRGLTMMKEHLETGTVPTQTKVVGADSRSAFHYVGRKRSCATEEIGPAMTEDLTALESAHKDGKLPAPSAIISIYHKFDMVKGQCDYTSAYLYDEAVNPPEGFESGSVPPHRALQVNHKGAYRHLGNGWAAAMGCARGLHKLNKRVPMYEVYGNNPNEVAETETLVDIYVPVK